MTALWDGPDYFDKVPAMAGGPPMGSSDERRSEDVEQREAKWAARDAMRERHEAIMQESAERERLRLVGVVEAALEDWGDPVGGAPWADVAEVAIAALKADGVVFAYLGSWDDTDDSGRRPNDE